MAVMMTIENWQEQLRRGTLELAVLLAVAPAPRYGLEILRHLAVTEVAVPEGTVYPLLARLEREGLLSAEWVSDEAPRSRKSYRLTPIGRSRLKAMCREFRAVAGGIEQMIAGALGEHR